MKIIVGLGNPGEQYQNTRHNIGWMALDSFLGDVHWQENKKFNSLIYRDGEFLFVKPQTFINNSGQAVQKILNYYDLLPKNLGIIKKKNSDLSEVLLIIHDDIDLDFGTKKISINSGSAGHNGVKSIINYLKTQNFKRLRLGVKNDLIRTKIPPDKFVLQAFSSTEKESLQALLEAINIKEI